MAQPYIAISFPFGAGNSFLGEERGESHFLPAGIISNLAATIVALFWAGLALFLVFCSQSVLRVLITTCAAIVFLNLASFVAGGAVVPRYLIPSIPESIVLAGLFWTFAAQGIASLLANLRNEKLLNINEK
jgi:hypothetical protein